jgi:crotonobetainyl-CoA:carnitine CoA-transferase CaiB-like acyl-CoA transferase
MKALVTVPGCGVAGAPVTLVNHPVLYDSEPAQVRLPPQPLGAQTEEVLKEIGLADAEIAALAEAGVIKLRDR